MKCEAVHRGNLVVQSYLQGGLWNLESGRSALVTPDGAHTQVSKSPLSQQPLEAPFCSPQEALVLDLSLPAGGPVGSYRLLAACWGCTLWVVPRPGCQPACLYCPQGPWSPQAKDRCPTCSLGVQPCLSARPQVSGLPWGSLGTDPTAASGQAWPRAGL